MKSKYINIILFFICITGIGLVNLFTEDRLISEYENRALEQFPEFSVQVLFSGDYFKKIDLYFSDQFLWRDSFVRISSGVKELKGLPGSDGATIIVQGGFNDAEEHDSLPDINEWGEKVAPEPDSRPEEVIPEPSAEPELTPDLEAYGNEKPEITPGPTNDPVMESTPEPAEKPTEKPEPTPIPASEKDDNGRRIGRILIYNNSAMQLFKANSDAEAHYANTLNSFKERAADQIKVYSLLAPTSAEFIDNDKYKSLTDSQKDAITRVNDKLNGVIPVDAYTKLKEHKGEYIYFRTDHHWTALGAYYAYTAFADSAGFDAVSLDRYETENIENYLGSMYDMTSSSTLRKNPDTITVYKPFVKSEYNVWYEGPVKLKVIDMYHATQKNKYRVFISGDRPLGIIKTEVSNGKKILIIKDSYGNAMVPFLLPHYEEIYVVDPRQYGKNIFNLIQDNEIQEVLFLNYALIVGDNSFADLIIKVMNQ
ncbi:MAG: hypothetical protein GX213_10335 [Clostridiaceae bacterium]|nr:hypothetical protein [Clostridiaceae bacterium]